ncbi:hypothetical protein DL93DRAFT_2125900 [Clavulina sp. PMI_390]|nr:hypothetical protein DL93DRAFT_2125900 [Clavulina sp. PMI_390]
MKQKLSGGRFRMINELLYKSESSSAHELMRDDPSTFHDYHVGFRNQVQSWPTNPVDYFTQSISSTHSAKSTVIVDLGCGDAALAKQLAKQGFKVLSFDLVSDGEWVTEADICDKIPLPGKEETDSAQIVDVCVCALSLMSTNWLRCVREARRILKMKGEFDIAEVTSRFPDINGFVALISSVGFELVKKTEPSSHFTIFKFRKVPLPKPLTRKDWASLETRSKELLTPCEYKRR